MISRRLILAAPLGLLAPAAFGQTAVAGPAAAIQMLDSALIMVMKAGKTLPFATRAAMLTPVVQHVFDLETLLQSSVGLSRWNSIAEAQKTELLDAFTGFTVSSYVGNFDAFNGESFAIAPDLRHVGRDVVVQTKLMGAGGDPTRLDYQMREIGGNWRVVDILLDGSISRVAVTRSDFRALLSRGDVGGLIASLRQKSSNLANGAAT